MKRYWDLEDKERAALSYQDVADFLDVELMERGALRPKPPVPEPIADVKLATRTVYCIKNGHRELDLAFATPEMAHAFVRLGALRIERDWQAGNVEYGEPLDSATVQSRELTTKEAATASRAILRENAARKERNEKAEREYQKAVEALDQETRSIWEDWHRCCGLVRAHEQVHETWQKYLQLADGDRTIAWRFLGKAYPESRIRDAFAWMGLDCADLGAPPAPVVRQAVPEQDDLPL